MKSGHYSFVISGVFTTLTVVFMSIILTSGRSLLEMKKRPAVLPKHQITAREIEGVGYPYGIGVIFDQFGNDWNEGDAINTYDINFLTTQKERPAHFVRLISCEDHATRGKLTAACCCIILMIAVVGIITSLASMERHGHCTRQVAFVCQACLFVFSLIGMGAAVSVYHSELQCNYKGTKITIAMLDYFDLGEALPLFAISAFFHLSSVLIIKFTGGMSSHKQQHTNKK